MMMNSGSCTLTTLRVALFRGSILLNSKASNEIPSSRTDNPVAWVIFLQTSNRHLADFKPKGYRSATKRTGHDMLEIIEPSIAFLLLSCSFSVPSGGDGLAGQFPSFLCT